MIPEAWRRDGDGFAGELLLLPDRGYNVEGTIDYRARINRIWFRFTPQPSGAATDATGRLTLALVDTMLLSDGAGQPMTGLDPESVRAAEGGLPPLPVARNGRVSVDPEAVVRLPDGSLLVGDEYGPNIYRFTASGRLVSATAPPAALTPMRRGRADYSSDNPAPGGPHPSPKNPETGRQNNQGLEGLALSPDRKTVTAVLQSATRQDGGDDPATRRFTRALVYNATRPGRACAHDGSGGASARLPRTRPASRGSPRRASCSRWATGAICCSVGTAAPATGWSGRSPYIGGSSSWTSQAQRTSPAPPSTGRRPSRRVACSTPP